MYNKDVSIAFLRSSLTEKNRFISTKGLVDWIDECKANTRVNVEQTSFDKLDKWNFDSKQVALQHETIFIDDGSSDCSYKELLRLKSQYPGDCIRIIKFTRNFGQIAAIRAGYQYAKGKAIITIGADLQDPPEAINQMLAYHHTQDTPIVACYREQRDESFFRKITSKIFYFLMKKLCFSQMPYGGFDVCLISEGVRDIIITDNDTNPFWQGQLLWTGFEVKFIPTSRHRREIGKSKWTFTKKIKYLIDGIMGYSYTPIRFMTLLGLLVSTIGFFYAIVIICLRIFGQISIVGWAPLMIVTLVLSGIQMMMLGIVGEYLWRTLDQTRLRRSFIVECVLE